MNSRARRTVFAARKRSGRCWSWSSPSMAACSASRRRVLRKNDAECFQDTGRRLALRHDQDPARLGAADRNDGAFRTDAEAPGLDQADIALAAGLAQPVA